jgi:V/A-type H+-transporting ATPase subunit D
MSDITPTRSALIELKDERRAMHEGYLFLDEKCLLLAGEILRQLVRYGVLQARFTAANDNAAVALAAAVGRHGLQGLQVYAAADWLGAEVVRHPRSLMGVRLQEAELTHADAPRPGAVNRSPEAEACRDAFTELLTQAAALAALSGNLERLYFEYRRSVRRARALQDVLLPEIDRTVYDIETRLEEIEQEDAIWTRQRV